MQMLMDGRGSPTTMPAKMIKLMPLPIPRSVICSPIHMMKAVPVVRVIMTMKRKPQPGIEARSGPAAAGALQSDGGHEALEQGERRPSGSACTA